jgi:hypothetical protein
MSLHAVQASLDLARVCCGWCQGARSGAAQIREILSMCQLDKAEVVHAS